MKNKITLELRLKVTFIKHGVSDQELIDNMEAIASRAAGDGLMTGETEAEVETWESDVLEGK